MSTVHPDLQHFRAELRDAIENDLVRRKSRRRERALRVGVPGLAVALGLSLTFVLGGSQAAFAGWSPSPTGASATQTSTADAACQARLVATPSTPGTVTGGWNVVATDVRGPFTLVVYRNGGSSATCLTGPSITIISQSSAGGHSMSVSRSVPRGGKATAVGESSEFSENGSGGIEHITLTHLASNGQGPFTFVEGQVDDGVAGVTFVLSNGQHVQATTDNGWILAWWPGGLDATSAVVTTAGGTSTQELSHGGATDGGAESPPTTFINDTGNS